MMILNREYEILFFRHKNSLFRHNRFSTLLFSMKVAESGEFVLVSWIIDFKDIKLWLRPFSLSLNVCKGMMVVLIFSGQILKKTSIPLQTLRLKLNCLNQSCISLKSIMQLTNTNSPDSATFIESEKVNFVAKKNSIISRIKCIAAVQNPCIHTIDLITQQTWCPRSERAPNVFYLIPFIHVRMCAKAAHSFPSA